jgi:hypothetical protein
VDGDRDGDLIVFEPFSSQPIGVWLNDGAGSFHEGRLADFRKLWSDQPGSAWRARFQRIGASATSELRPRRLLLRSPHRNRWSCFVPGAVNPAFATDAVPISARALHRNS